MPRKKTDPIDQVLEQFEQLDDVRLGMLLTIGQRMLKQRNTQTEAQTKPRKKAASKPAKLSMTTASALE